MKTVFTNAELPHIWAYQSQNEGRTPNGSFYFNRESIYSYGRHFVIATIVESTQTVFFTERSYSNTTVRHIYKTAAAIPFGFNKIYCPYPPTFCGYDENRKLFSNKEENFKYWLNEAEFSAKKLTNARKPEIYLSQLQEIENKVNAFCKYFKIKAPKKLQNVLSVKDKEDLSTYLKKQKEAEKRQKAKERKAKAAYIEEQHKNMMQQ